MYLGPEVRYNIQNKEELMFADVKCTYLIENQNVSTNNVISEKYYKNENKTNFSEIFSQTLIYI